MRGRVFGDLLVVFLLPLVALVVSAFLAAVVMAQGWGIPIVF
ncbi:hypothetical protein [Saccharopolyspora montiporae]|nr:hypothetical protein [Saccharopolyspora sp. HNM0983]